MVFPAIERNCRQTIRCGVKSRSIAMSATAAAASAHQPSMAAATTTQAASTTASTAADRLTAMAAQYLATINPIAGMCRLCFAFLLFVVCIVCLCVRERERKRDPSSLARDCVWVRAPCACVFCCRRFFLFACACCVYILRCVLWIVFVCLYVCYRCSIRNSITHMHNIYIH